MDDHFAEGDAQELELIAEAIEDVLSGVRSSPGISQVERRFDDILIGHHSASLYIEDRGGRQVYASPGSVLAMIQNDLSVPSRDGMVRQWDDGEHSYRVLARDFEDEGSESGGSYSILVAVPIDYHLQFLSSFRRTLWLMVVSSIGVISLMGWIAVRQGHAPLRNIVTRIRQISAEALDDRVPPETVPLELSDLAISFNEMLGRVDEAFHRLADFNADIAHELRTPITNLTTQTEVALTRARSVDEYREVLYSNMEEYERMAQMVGDMLLLAQADHGQLNKNLTEVDLSREVEELIDFYDGWAEERGVSLIRDGHAETIGDRIMIRRALGNLLSNAVRHTPSGQAVQVTLSLRGRDEVEISVKNPGPEIPSEHLSKLFDRFYRVDPSRQRSDVGAGLGLALVKSIVVAHGGKVEVTSTGGFTEFRVTLPTMATQA